MQGNNTTLASLLESCSLSLKEFDDAEAQQKLRFEQLSLQLKILKLSLKKQGLLECGNVSTNEVEFLQKEILWEEKNYALLQELQETKLSLIDEMKKRSELEKKENERKLLRTQSEKIERSSKRKSASEWSLWRRSKAQDTIDSDNEKELKQQIQQLLIENEKLKKQNELLKEGKFIFEQEDVQEQVRSNEIVIKFLHNRVSELEENLSKEQEYRIKAEAKAANLQIHSDLLQQKIDDRAGKGASGPKQNEQDGRYDKLKLRLEDVQAKRKIAIDEVYRLREELEKFTKYLENQKTAVDQLRSKNSQLEKEFSLQESDRSQLVMEVENFNTRLEAARLQKVEKKIGTNDPFIVVEASNKLLEDLLEEIEKHKHGKLRTVIFDLVKTICSLLLEINIYSLTVYKHSQSKNSEFETLFNKNY